MSVYVDDMLREAAVTNGRHRVRGRWSHLMSDTTSELLEYADLLGLPPSWIQKAGTSQEHFDVTASKRLHALQLGALAISHAEGDHLVRAKRAGVIFDLQLLQADPEGFTAKLKQHTAASHSAALDAAAPTDGPRRVQLSRARGAHLPSKTVSVAAPTRWANPHRPATRTPQANAAAVEHFREYLARNPRLVDQAREQLTGLNLACWCAPFLPCHADVWLALVNGDPGTARQALTLGGIS